MRSLEIWRERVAAIGPSNRSMTQRKRRIAHRGARSALAMLAVSSAACGGLGFDGERGGGTRHPSGPTDLVLRIHTTGGFVPPQSLVTSIPEFSLMGDGTVIVTGPIPEIYPGPALPNLLFTTVTEEGIQMILEEARRAGLFGPDAHYDYPYVTDLPTTTFTLFADGQRHVISAYALGFEVGVEDGGTPASEENREARAALSRLRDRLLSLREWLPADAIDDERPFESDELRIYVSSPSGRPDDTEVEPTKRDWPLDLSLAGFGEAADLPPDSRCGTVGGESLAILLPALREANQLTLWEDGGEAYSLLLRPLLPDESGCPQE